MLEASLELRPVAPRLDRVTRGSIGSGPPDYVATNFPTEVNRRAGEPSLPDKDQ